MYNVKIDKTSQGFWAGFFTPTRWRHPQAATPRRWAVNGILFTGETVGNQGSTIKIGGQDYETHNSNDSDDDACINARH